MAFVVDGSEWRFDGWTAEDLFSALDKLLARIAVARSRSETIWVGDDLQSRPVFGSSDLWSLCSVESSLRLSPELTQELAAWLSHAPCYLDEANWPEGLADYVEVGVAAAPREENSDIAWAHHNVRAGRAVGCLSLIKNGVFPTSTDLGTVDVHWVNDSYSQLAFWRDAVVVEGDNAETLRRLAGNAYPDLFVHEDAWQGMKEFVGGYLAIRKIVKHYLAVINDSGKWVFVTPPPALTINEEVHVQEGRHPSSQLIQQRFHALNLDMAPENPNVYSDRKCREAREVQVGNRILYCEWHGKLQPNRNRVHIHGPVPESGDRVVIGVFHDHLPLP